MNSLLLNLISQIVIIVSSSWVSNGNSCDTTTNTIKKGMISESTGIITTSSAQLEWYYTVWTNKIVICKQSKEKLLTLVHEIGHFVYYMKMNERGRFAWNNIEVWSGKMAYVSEYGINSQVEDFAETFMFVILWKDKELEKIFFEEDRKDIEIRDKKISFMKNILKYLSNK